MRPSNSGVDNQVEIGLQTVGIRRGEPLESLDQNFGGKSCPDGSQFSNLSPVPGDRDLFAPLHPIENLASLVPEIPDGYFHHA